MNTSCNVCVDVWGDYALFTQPDAKVERVTYDVPTPSGCRGVLNAIYSKPAEFYYEITGIEVMNPIRYYSMKRNEVARKADKKLGPIYVEEERTQRGSVMLKDVYYRIHAKMHVREDAPKEVNVLKIQHEFNKRIRRGKCFYQPYLGTRECMAFFAPPDQTKKPIDESKDLGYMLYDIFDIRSNVPLDTEMKTGSKRVTVFHAVMNHGRISIPPYDVVTGGTDV